MLLVFYSLNDSMNLSATIPVVRQIFDFFGKSHFEGPQDSPRGPHNFLSRAPLQTPEYKL